MFSRFLYPFLRYRGAIEQLGPPFLVLCVIALPCWVVYRRYRLRTSGHALSSRREILLLTALVYLLGLATVTLAPTHASRARRAHGWWRKPVHVRRYGGVPIAGMWTVTLA